MNWVDKLDRLRRRAGVDMGNNHFVVGSRWSISFPPTTAHSSPELGPGPGSSLVMFTPQYHPVDWRSLEVGKVATGREDGDTEDESLGILLRKCVG
jgi:hypothetical protein